MDINSFNIKEFLVFLTEIYDEDFLMEQFKMWKFQKNPQKLLEVIAIRAGFTL